MSMSRPALVAIAASIVVVAVLVAVGLRAAERDRAEIRARLAAAKLASLTEAAGELAHDVEKIGEDLELAATLMTQTADADDRARELHAIAAITREYMALEVRDGAGRTLARVVAPDAPPGVLAHAVAALDETSRLAVTQPGVFRTSGPLGADDTAFAWYRVFARRSPTNDDVVVAVVVDMRPLLERMRLLQSPTSRLLVVGARGRPAPSSDPRLAEVIRALPAEDRGALGRLMTRVRERAPGVEAIDERASAALGLPAVASVAVTAPVLIEDGEPWALALVVSTAELRDQERLVARRLLVLGAIAAVAVLGLAAYVVRNARRAAVLHERLRHADRMAHAQKLVTAGQLAAGIAHEIGTPLNVVRARAELVTARLGREHPAVRDLNIVCDQIDHVAKLLTQLLDYVRTTPRQLVAVPARAARAAVAELVEVEADKRSIKVAIECDGAVGAVAADPGQLQQVLVNLTMNALDACGPGAAVTLRATAAPGAVVLEVEDEGEGIAPEARAQVFDPFFTTKKRGRGTGLGLWVVAQLAQTHDATVELCAARGGGTIARLRWPAPRETP